MSPSTKIRRPKTSSSSPKNANSNRALNYLVIDPWQECPLPSFVSAVVYARSAQLKRPTVRWPGVGPCPLPMFE